MGHNMTENDVAETAWILLECTKSVFFSDNSKRKTMCYQRAEGMFRNQILRQTGLPKAVSPKHAEISDYLRCWLRNFLSCFHGAVAKEKKKNRDENAAHWLRVIGGVGIDGYRWCKMNFQAKLSSLQKEILVEGKDRPAMTEYKRDN